MAEYTNVEKPFLEKLQLLGWRVINQGQGIPQEADKSVRGNFKEVVLPKVFKERIKAINTNFSLITIPYYPFTHHNSQ